MHIFVVKCKHKHALSGPSDIAASSYKYNVVMTWKYFCMCVLLLLKTYTQFLSFAKKEGVFYAVSSFVFLLFKWTFKPQFTQMENE